MADFYDPAEGLTPEAWHARMARRLGETVALAWARTAAGRRAVAAAGRPPSDLRWPEDLSLLPLLRKADLSGLQAADPPFAGWVAVPLEELSHIFVSPGPIYDPAGRSEDYWGFAPALHAAGFRRGDLVLNTFAYHLTPAGHMLDRSLAALGCVVIPGGVGNTEVQARTARDLRIRGYVGTPSFLAALLQKIDPPSPFAVAFVSGEMLPDGLRRDLQAREVRVFQGYATADVGLIAYECGEHSGLHLSSRVFVEIVDPERGTPQAPGAVGEVVVTFLSEVYPLLRLATGDLSTLDPSPCPCGRGSPRLARLVGRVGEAVKVRGLFVHPEEVRRAFSRIPEVGRYQMVVSREGHRDRLLARVEPSAGGAVDPAALGGASAGGDHPSSGGGGPAAGHAATGRPPAPGRAALGVRAARTPPARSRPVVYHRW